MDSHLPPISLISRIASAQATPETSAWHPIAAEDSRPPVEYRMHMRDPISTFESRESKHTSIGLS